MSRVSRMLIGLLALTISAAPALARELGPLGGSAAPLDYTHPANWVCRPGSADCQYDLTATVLRADGSRELEPFRMKRATQADCFYVYPTVSESPGLTAEPRVTEAERRAVRQQVARLGSVCRLFVPLYRQVTYTSMKPGFQRPSRESDLAANRRADQDLLAAWEEYVAHENRGRPFVLIGHSQGAMRLIRLIQQRIDGQPIQNQLLFAILPGAGVLVPVGKSTGGTFKSVPPCRQSTQTGCVIAFNAIRSETVLPADIKPQFLGQELVCTNPAALSGGPGELKPYLSTTGETIIPDLTAKQPAWTRDASSIQTPFVAPVGLYSAECRIDEHGAFLVVSTRLGANDVRTGAMVGDWMVGSVPLPVMGLHLIDLNLTAGNVVDLIHNQLADWH